MNDCLILAHRSVHLQGRRVRCHKGIHYFVLRVVDEGRDGGRELPEPDRPGEVELEDERIGLFVELLADLTAEILPLFPAACVHEAHRPQAERFRPW